MKWEVKYLSQGSIKGIEYAWASTAIDAINQVEAKINPINENGKRKEFYCYEARYLKPFELS